MTSKILPISVKHAKAARIMVLSRPQKKRVVVAPYQIMLGTKRFNVSAVIFDEAHNLPEIIRQEGTSLLNFAKVLRKLSAHRKVTQSESIFFQKILGFVMENMENEALLWPSKLIKTGYLNNLTKFEENYCKLPFSRQNKCVLRLFGQLKRMKKKPMSYAIVRKERVLSLVLVDPREKFKKLVEIQNAYLLVVLIVQKSIFLLTHNHQKVFTDIIANPFSQATILSFLIFALLTVELLF